MRAPWLVLTVVRFTALGRREGNFVMGVCTGRLLHTRGQNKMGVGARIGIAEDTSRGQNLRSLDVSATRTQSSSRSRQNEALMRKVEANGEDASHAQADREERFHTRRARQLPDHPTS